MTPDESKKILELLADAYPRFDMSPSSVSLYQQMFAPLDYTIAERAALEWIKAERWFPTVAEFREYARKARRDIEGEQLALAARAADPAPANVPDPEVAEMVAAALRSWSMPDVPPPDLEEHPAGECADCRKSFEVLRSYGGSGRPLCPKCLGARLRVAAKLEASAEVGTQP